MDYFIGLDIGTSSAKAVAFSANGEVLASHAITYGISHPQSDWSEQDPYEITEAVINSIHKIGIKLVGHQPLMISFSAAMHSIIAVDEDGRPLTNCIIWADNRAVEIAEDLRQTDTGRSFYYRSGVPVHPMSPLCKLLWLKQNQLDVFSVAHKFIGIKEFFFLTLFGKYIVDTGMASATGFFNVHTRHWDEKILAFMALEEVRLSKVVSPYHIEYLQPGHWMSRLTTFSKTAFVVGSSDGGLANLGNGAIGRGSVAITIGTSAAARMVTQDVYTDEQMRTFCYHLKDDCYIAGGASSNGAIVLKWLKESLLQHKESMENFFSMAATVPPGCDDLLFLPYILGERAPLWNSKARGVFFGLSITHGKAHLIRSAMEAVVYNLYSIGKILMEREKITTIFANGGFAGSQLWIQMLADMFNVTVFVNDIEESSAWGAVMVGMEALGTPAVEIKPTGKKYEPDPANHRIYLQCFEKFERVYGLVKGEFVFRAEVIPEPAAKVL
ncbi:MAG: gluconokinase [Ferruginibacter sp.]